MLVINPDECIDCGVCVPECPAEAIFPESEDLVSWVEINREYSKKWPVITKKKPPLPDAEQYDGEKNKFEKYVKSEFPISS
jgi:ferredoxin